MGEAWESEERDDRGRFAGGGGGGGSGSAGPLKDEAVEGQAVESAQTWASTLNVDALSFEQKDAMRDWTRSDVYGNVNGALRGGGDVPPELQSQIQNMDSAIAAQAPTAAPTVLYRSVSGDAAQQYASAGPGESIRDPGYAATTPNLVTAAKFSAVAQTAGGAGYGGEPQVLEIQAPAGTQGFAMGAWNPSPTFNETTLPRGSTFEVLEQHPPTTLEAPHWTVSVPARTVVALRPS